MPHSRHISVPGPNTLFGRGVGQLAAGGNAPFIDCVLSSCPHAGSQKSGCPTDLAPAWSPPVSLALAEPWNRAPLHSPVRPSQRDAEILLLEPSCHWFLALVSPVQLYPWMRSSAGLVCEFWHHGNHQTHPDSYLTFYSLVLPCGL